MTFCSRPFQSEPKFWQRIQKHKTILKWEETNIPSYQDAIEKVVLENLSNNSDVDIQDEDIINLIVTTSKTNVTNKTVTLKGPS